MKKLGLALIIAASALLAHAVDITAPEFTNRTVPTDQDFVIGYRSSDTNVNTSDSRYQLSLLWSAYLKAKADALYQPLDGGLTSLSGKTVPGLYYLSATDVWSPVTIGGGLALTSGTLSATGTGTGDMLFATFDTDSNGAIDIAKGGTNATTASAARTNLGLAIGSNVQAYSAELAALSGLSGTGIYYRSGTGAYTLVTIGTGLSFSTGTLSATGTSGMTNPMTTPNDIIYGGTSGAPTRGTLGTGLSISGGALTLDGDLQALAGLSSTGIYYRSATDTFSLVTIGSGLTFSGGTLSSSGSSTSEANAHTFTDSSLYGLSGVATGKIVYLNGSTWAYAQANAQGSSAYAGMVQTVNAGVSTVVVKNGLVTGLSGLTAGTWYYLSDTVAGGYTATAPTTPGTYQQRVFLALTTTTAWMCDFSGFVSNNLTSNADLATMATGTVKANVSGSTASPSDVAITGNSSLYAALTPTTNAQTGAYTLVATDKNKKITVTSGSSALITVPTDASVSFPEGTQIEIQRLGAGSVTVGGSGVTINNANGLSILSQYDIGILEKTGSANTWTFYTAAAASGSSATWDSIQAKGTDIASAGTINLETATGNLVDVTGTTTITTVTLGAGHTRWVRFTGALALTNGASLVLPTGANITTAAGDTAFFVGDASSVVRVFAYSRATGAALAGSGSGTVTNTSVVTANGFAGTVATSTSTPAITLTTSVTGMLKGNGTAISAATSGTDYLAPGTQFGYIQLLTADQTDGTNATRITTEGTTYGQMTLKNGVAKASNYVLYRFLVPPDIKTATNWTAQLTVRLGGADTGSHYYEISMADVASSASADSPTFSNATAIQFSGDASGAANDIETSSAVSLAWGSSLTAGHMMVVKLARDGTNGADTSTVDSNVVNLTLKYPSAQ